jgi:glycogen debranching enzyme
MTTVPVIAHFDPDWAAEIIENFTQHLDHHDCPPFAVAAFPRFTGKKRRWSGSQAPIAAWAVSKLIACSDAVDATPLIRRLYPSLKLIVERWFEYGDYNNDGIPDWVNTGAPGDDSARFDKYASGKNWYNIYLPPMVAMDLCAYLTMEMRCLAAMARKLELPQEAHEWERQRRDFEAKTLLRLWNARERIFYDVDVISERHNKVKTFYNLLPLWAGMSLPESDAREAIEAHLLNPDELWGEVPFPSVAYNEPTYDPLGYVRGRCWPHFYFWNTEILAKYGYDKEAKQAKRRFLSVLADAVDIPENLVSSLKVNERRNHGFPHYSWGLAITLMFLWDWHLKPV